MDSERWNQVDKLLDRYELSIAEADKAIAMDPDLAPPYATKAFSQLLLNRLADAEITVGRAAERKLEFDEYYLVRYFIAFLNRDGDQKVLDHRTIVLADPMGALARLQLARALVLSGDSVKAKSEYNDLLTLWKNADPGIPVVEAARAEYARLQ